MIEGFAQKIAQSVLKGKTFSVERLLRYGFEREGEKYCFSAPLLNGDASLTVVVRVTGKVWTQVLDLSIQDYVTRLVCNDDSGEGLAGDLRRECERILSDIATSCTE